MLDRPKLLDRGQSSLNQRLTKNRTRGQGKKVIEVVKKKVKVKIGENQIANICMGKSLGRLAEIRYSTTVNSNQNRSRIWTVKR